MREKTGNRIVRLGGFTLLELLAVITIAGILSAIAVPSLRVIYLNNQRAEASTSLYGALVQARSEAVSRNSYVLVCPRVNPGNNASIPPACQMSTSDWTQGWIVLRDANNNGQLDAGEPASGDVIATGDPMSPEFTVATTNSSQPGAAVGFVPFDASGNSTSTLGASSAYTFTLCRKNDHSADGGRIVRVEFGGRVSLEKLTC